MLFYRPVYILLFLFFINCHKEQEAPPVIPFNPSSDSTTFTNPLLPSGPDPWVVQKDSLYYFTHTFGNKIALYTTTKMSELDKAPLTTIWTPPAHTAYSKNIWAPELHYLQGKWYVYFAADDGQNKNHRLYVLENTSANPLSGNWNFKGKVADSSDKWAIDGTALEYHNQLYFIWSGWEGNANVAQNIYIAKMKNPWTLKGSRVMISSPTYSWEKAGAPPAVNEGPEVLKNSQGHIFLTFSASGCWTEGYSLGLLTLKENGDPMNPADWTKTPTPVFTSKPENGAYAPGHNSFFKSKDGTEDWILYHANTKAGQGCGNSRNPRMQLFTWKADGTPAFGEPEKINIPIKKPSGE